MSGHVDDDIVTGNRGGDCGSVEKVERNRLGTLQPQRKCFRIVAGYASYVMIGPYKQRDEAPADCTGCAGNKNIQWEPIYRMQR